MEPTVDDAIDAIDAIDDTIDVSADFLASVAVDPLADELIASGYDEQPNQGEEDEGEAGSMEEASLGVEDEGEAGSMQDGVEEEESDEEDPEERAAEMERARLVLLERGFRPRDAPRPPPLLQTFDLCGVVRHIASKPCRNIVLMCGAGISVSAGIPDFRTPGTGLYDNLQKYDLPSPQSIFELSYFRERPDAFYRLCAELWPDNFAPTCAASGTSPGTMRCATAALISHRSTRADPAQANPPFHRRAARSRAAPPLLHSEH